MRLVKLAWGEIVSASNENPVSAEGQLSNLLSKYHELFTVMRARGGLGHISSMKSKAYLCENMSSHLCFEGASREIDNLETHAGG